MQTLWQDLRCGAVLFATGIAVAVLLVGLSAVRAQDAPSARTQSAEEISAALQRALNEEVAATPSLPGELLHVYAPKLGLQRSFAAGLFDRASKRPLEPQHVFRIASVTKTFVAAAVLRLHEDGKLNVDDSCQRYLSKEYVELLEADGYATQTITLRHLLTHTSGIYDYAADDEFQKTILKDPRHRWTRLEQVQWAVKYGQPYFAPGAGLHYSDTGYVLLGAIVERVSKQDLAKALRTLLNFKKLGLHATWLETLEPAPPGAAELSHPYYSFFDTVTFDPSFDLYGGGGLISSTEDLARFLRGLFTRQVFRKPETLSLMLGTATMNRTTNAKNNPMGIHHRDINEDCWGHGGFWGTLVYHCPRSDVTIARQINQAQPEKSFRSNALMLRVAELLGLGK